ncbi:putative thiazole biosynthetic enzyme [mine drainage metagenome]|uniref:Putative thiazole biosynthetic enzyme n=1 Tax=mine drainage metagenome TaxID=410659 RepID=A0A1J5SQR8_9ZZZZ
MTAATSDLCASTPEVCIVGGGPAGLLAAQELAAAGFGVALYDAMPSVGRKFLLAGKGGLNLTHGEDLERFISRYGASAGRMAPLLRAFGPAEVRAWAADLGIETFVGSSGRVFPAEFKAAPLMRAWVRRLRALNVALHPRCRWTGFTAEGALRFSTPRGLAEVRPRAALLALGGASWPRLGSDGGWVPLLAGLGCAIAPLAPANCGFHVDWSPHLRALAGTPLKNVALSFGGQRRTGEAMLSEYGLEGGLVYALSAPLREAIAERGTATAWLDLKPDLPQADLAARLSRPRGRLSWPNWLKKALALPPAAIALLREGGPDAAQLNDPAWLAARLKALPLTLTAPRPLAEAISSAGGLAFEELDDTLMLRRRPGLFAAGEMLDWEAPTGGYLLTGCLATGHRAAQGMAAWLRGAAPNTF